MPPWTRASELSRSIRCPASTVLPRAPDTRKGAADFGTAVHAYCSGEGPGPQVAEWLAQQPDATNPRGEGISDVLLALDTEDGPDVFVVADRDTRNWVRASLPASYVAGECDWVMWPEPWVKDLKTGWHPGRAHELEQMLFYSLALMRKADTYDGYATIVHWPADGAQPPLDVTDHLDRGKVQRWWDNKVVPASRLARGPSPEPTPGDWCRFCPCYTCDFNWEANQGANL